MVQVYIRLLVMAASLGRHHSGFALYPRFIPLCGLMTSRYHRDDAVRISPYR